jgi:PAS domain S-box-containing protein
VIAAERIPHPYPIRLQVTERACLSITALIAVVVLLGWLITSFGLRLPAGWDIMKANTAAGILLACTGFALSARVDGTWRRPLTLLSATLLGVLALFALIEHASGRHFWIDTLVAVDPGTATPGLMSSQTASGLLMLGLLLPWIWNYRRPLSMVEDGLVLLLAALVMVMLAGYTFGAARIFGDPGNLRLSPHTLACFVLLTAVAVMRRTGGGVFSVLRGTGIGSRIARVAIPLGLLLPVTLSFMHSYAVSTGLLQPSYASAVATSFICICVTLLTLLMGWRINRLEREVRELMERHSEQELQASEQRYMGLVEQSISGFMVRRPDGQLVLVNEAYRKMTGYSREELLTLNAKDLVVDQGVIARVQKLQPGESTHIETFLKRKDSSLLEVEYVTQRLHDGNLQTVILDISHRKQLQKQRDESERRYSELVDQALEGIMVRSPHGDIVFVNETFCRMLDYPRSELLKLNIRDIVHPEDAETIRQIQQLGHGGHLHLKKRMLRRDKGVVYVEVSAKRLRNGDIQTTVQDVTEQRAALQAHAESEQRYHDLVEQAADAIWLRSAGGRMLFVNDAGCELLGYTREELLLSASADLIHDSDPDTSAPIDMLKPLQTLRLERVMRHKDGHPIPVEASCHRLADGATQVISHDISERKRSADELREMSRRLSEAQETERRAIARELHDEVGQSLTATRINLRDLEQDAEDGPFAQRLTDAATIISDLLSKVRQMSLDLHPSVLDDLGLGPALRWCVRTRTTGSKLEVTVDVPDELSRFNDMAEITLFRIFQEALSNALRHSQAQHLEARLRHVDGRLHMTVKDDGRGFDAEASRQHALSGKSLGLLGMQERARLAGGELTLTSAPGRGTEVSVSLPADER